MDNKVIESIAWQKMDNLDNSNEVFSGMLPVPAFKITMTD